MLQGTETVSLSCLQFFEEYIGSTGLDDPSSVDPTRDFLRDLGHDMEVELSVAFTPGSGGGLTAHPARVSAGTYDFIHDRDCIFVESAIRWLSRVADGHTWPAGSLWRPECIATESSSAVGFGFESIPGRPLRLKSYYRIKADANARLTRYTIAGAAKPSLEIYSVTGQFLARESLLIQRLRDAGMRICETIRIGARLLVEFVPVDSQTAIAAIMSIDRDPRPIAELVGRVLSKQNYLACLALDTDVREITRCVTYFRRRRQ